MFSTILETLAEQGNGIHAYRAVARLSYGKAVECPEQAAAFFLLATVAETFVDRHERMPLLSKETEESFKSFSDDLGELSEAYEGGDPETILVVLNRIAGKHAAQAA